MREACNYVRAWGRALASNRKRAAPCFYDEGDLAQLSSAQESYTYLSCSSVLLFFCDGFHVYCIMRGRRKVLLLTLSVLNYLSVIDEYGVK